MTNCFHLAIPAGNIKTALGFYCDILGCKTGNQEEGHWIDVNFWGNELTLHETKTKQVRERHHVDMGDVCIPHFGVHLEMDQYQQVRENVLKNNGFLDKPYVRFEGTDYQQETFFVQDPNHNVLEIKHMVNPRES